MKIDQPIYADSVLFGFCHKQCTSFDAAHLYTFNDRAYVLSRSYCAPLSTADQIFVIR